MEADPLRAPRVLCIYVLVWLSVSSCPVLGISIASANDMGEGRLVKTLTSVDRAKVRPTMDYTKPTHVTFEFSLLHIKELNMAKQELVMTGGFNVKWNDPFLAWNISDHENIYFTRLSAASLWTPTFIIANSLNGREDETEWKKGEVMVLYDGNITWNPSGVFHTSCDVNVVKFPFDTQTCKLNVFSLLATEKEIIYTGVKGDGPHGVIENSEWKIIKHEVTTRNYLSSGGNTSTVYFSYTFERQSGYYIATIILPMVLLFFVGLMVFPLPADSGEKISLCVACLMAFVLTQLIIAEQIPRGWKSVPVIVIFNTLFMLLNVLSVVMTVLVLNLHHKQTVNDVPMWLDLIFERRWKSLPKGRNKVESSELKVLDIPNAEVEKINYNVISENGEKSIASLLSSFLEVVQKRADEQDNRVDEAEVIKKKWRDVADAVNAILCGLYILIALVMGLVCMIMWRV